MHRIGIDLGGTKIEGVVLDPGLNEVFRQRIDTEQQHGYKHILRRIQGLYDRMAKEIQGVDHTLGLGAPGAVSPSTGNVKNSNTVCLNGMPIKNDLEKLLKRPIEVQNDANCFVLAEALEGAGKGYGLVFGVIMGTGCGGGICYNGKVLDGLQAIAGEWGHMSIDPQGPTCYCGQRGCVETFISGGGLERKYERDFGKKLLLKDIVKLYRDGDPAMGKFMAFFLDRFGRSLGNLINILDPDVVVLGGGVSNIDELYTLGVKEVERYVFGGEFRTPIVSNQLGDSAGVIGAALIGI